MIFLASEHPCGFHNGKYYLVNRAYSIYVRYAEKFGDMILCSRLENLDIVPEDYREAAFVKEFIEIEDLKAALLGNCDKRMEDGIRKCRLVIARCPSVIAFRAADVARKCGVKVFAESMCDAWDSYWNHGVAGKLIAPYMFYKMKSVVKHADFALYVTQKFLQDRYPCPRESVGVSNVVIKSVDQDVLARRLEKIAHMDRKNISIMTTAGVSLHSKGQEYVVAAMGALKAKGILCTYYLAGDGDPEYLRGFARKAGVEDQLVFLGRIPLKEVYEFLDKMDLYIQPSLQEGLPRALIEAMSRSCPCLGARTAGIPELLDPECIVERKSPGSIAAAIEVLLESDLGKYARNNHEYSKRYLEENLNNRRNLYFRRVEAGVRE